MIAFIEMLVEPAKKAGMNVPSDVDNYDKNDFPHFWVLCTLQLGRPMPSMGCHWDNAKVIADIDLERLKTMTVEDFHNAGFQGL
jgi:hypothetical protein